MFQIFSTIYGKVRLRKLKIRWKMSWSFLIWYTLFHLIRGKNINHNRARLCTLPDTWISEPKQFCIKSDQDTQPSGQDFWFKKSDYNRFGEQLLCLGKKRRRRPGHFFSCTTSTPIQAEFFLDMFRFFKKFPSEQSIFLWSKWATYTM